MEIIYQDRRIIVAIKPAGVLSTNEPGGMPQLLREYLGDPQACVRTVHRLDQAVSGLMVFARSQEAARRLSAEMAGRRFYKEYLAVVHGAPPQETGSFSDLLLRDREKRMTLVVSAPGKNVQPAQLDYRKLSERDGLSLLNITLHTGRTHQIRCQCAFHGIPLAGDKKYGVPDEIPQIALWSHRLRFAHPETGETMDFSAPPPGKMPWDLFETADFS